MKREKNKELRAAGFKPVPLSEIWINSIGTAYNQRTGRQSRPRIIKTDGKEWITEKVVLWLFASIKPRGGQIAYSDGNKANKAVENLKYISTVQMQPETVNVENLNTAIRCFFEIERKEKFLPQMIETKIKLQMILMRYPPAFDYRSEKYYPVFENWLYKGCELLQVEASTPETERYTARERQTITAHYINRLTAEICTELEAGKRELLPFLPTKRELRNKLNAELKRRGIKRKTPARRLKEYKQAAFGRKWQRMVTDKLQAAKAAYPPEIYNDIEKSLKRIEKGIIDKLL